MRPYFDLGGEPNYTDLIHFLDMAYRGRSRYHPISRMEHKLFSGDYSLGFARPYFEKGDEIYAIDGVRALFILRRKDLPETYLGATDLRDTDVGARYLQEESGKRTNTPGYRIVGNCYMMAALELDCRNPAKTRMIEITWFTNERRTQASGAAENTPKTRSFES
jgi:hypothetical protein